MEPSRNPRAAASEEPTRPHTGAIAVSDFHGLRRQHLHDSLWSHLPKPAQIISPPLAGEHFQTEKGFFDCGGFKRGGEGVVRSISIGDATRQERDTGAKMTERLQRLLGSQLGMNLGGAPTDAPQVDTAEQVYISSLALLKMLKHGRAGVPMEVSENSVPITTQKKRVSVRSCFP